MTQNSRCGLPMPLGDDFDCDAYMARLADVEPPATLSPADINAWNRTVEANNNRSIQLTLAFSTARASGNRVGGLDVGAPLQPLYAYSEQLKKMFLYSKELVDSTGPLPSSLVQWLAMERMKIAEEEVAEKLKREQEKGKASVPLLGTLVMSNPVAFSSVTDDDVDIPAVYLTSLGQKINIPLQWWRSSILQAANESPHSVPTVQVRAEQSAAAAKIIIIKTDEMSALHGGTDDWTCLTPSLWLQCSLNLLAAIKRLSVEHDAADPRHSPYTELAQHIQFFNKNKWFDTHFQLWYPQEYYMRKKVLINTFFDRATWALELSGTMKAHEAAEARDARRPPAFAGFRGAPGPFTPAPSPGPQAGPAVQKRGANDDGNVGGGKRQKKGKNNDFRGPRDAACIICAGPHPANQHPAASQTFLDGSSHYARLDGKELRSTNGPADGSICIRFNIGLPCDSRHPPSRTHNCSLCGGPHPALSRNDACGRVQGGNLMP
ncbi:hypothetical protein B0H12DRAFT_1250407 [Mycena haematopus]|nr:hypothetical protein B0H12DRAFT_1250407 [Mycena haematopus]